MFFRNLWVRDVEYVFAVAVVFVGRGGVVCVVRGGVGVFVGGVAFVRSRIRVCGSRKGGGWSGGLVVGMDSNDVEGEGWCGISREGVCELFFMEERKNKRRV